MNSVEESDVGILCYVSTVPGFSGILKQRYSDFIVNEVDLDGTVVHLTSPEAPSEIMNEKQVKAVDLMDKDYTPEIESFRALAGESDTEKLENFIAQIGSAVNDDEKFIVLFPSSDKPHRTAIHNFFKERLKFLVTDTVDGPDSSSKCIRVRLDSEPKKGMGKNSRKRKNAGGKPYDSRGSDSWPEDSGKFLRFNLYKENKDTQEALGLLGKMLGIQPRSFGFAGTKDKRAVTTQRVTVYKQRASRLAALNEKLIGIKVGNFCYVNEGLVLGQLQGNRFTITLRSVTAEAEETIRASAAALGKNGFINYFGLQRFGSSSIPTHLIGAALLRGEWKAACNMILDPREGEKVETRKVREYYKKSGDIEGTLRQLPRYLVAERAIIDISSRLTQYLDPVFSVALGPVLDLFLSFVQFKYNVYQLLFDLSPQMHSFQKSPGNHLQALLAIPRTLRMMYVHSYQSYLWNHAASMRVQKYGIQQVVLGDLVYCKEKDIAEEATSSHVECQDDTCNDTNIDCDIDDVALTDLSEVKSQPVKAINEEDIISGRYSVYDIVLPLPGSRVIYPHNDIGKIFHDLATKDATSLTETMHNSKEFSLTNMTGAYRRVFQTPKDFEWELLKYTDVNVPLAETDWEVITKSGLATVDKDSDDKENFKLQSCRKHKDNKFEKEVELPEGTIDESEKKVDKQTEESQVASKNEKSQMALKLSFTLPTSSYATMAIRELLKISTSVAFHKTLNS